MGAIFACILKGAKRFICDFRFHWEFRTGMIGVVKDAFVWIRKKSGEE